MGRWLCTPYEGPETWETPRDEWYKPERWSPSNIHNEVDAATTYAEARWDGSDDPTDEQEIAVEETTTGQRWVVEVHAEPVVEWHGNASKVDPATGEVV